MFYEPPRNGFRTFLIVWATQSISVFGSALTLFAITVWLTTVLYATPEQKPQLALALSAVNLAFALPVVFGAPLAGAWADRHDRKRTMMACDFINGGLSITLAALVATGTLRLWMLLSGIAGVALVTAFHSAAFDTSYAMLVPEKQLPRANGMMQTMWGLSGVLAPGVAAAIITLPGLARQGVVPGAIGAALGRLSSGTSLAMTVDAITFLGAAATLLLLTIPSPRRTDLHDEATRRAKSLWADIKEGALFIRRRSPLLWLLATFAVANFASGPAEVLLPLVLKFNLASDWVARGLTYETALALVTTVGSIGGVTGGLLISTWGGLKKGRVYGVVVSLLAEGVALIAFGLSPLLFLSAAINFSLLGLVPIMNAHSQSIWQTQTPHEIQGRVFSVRRLIAQFTWPLSAAMAGWLGGVLNPGIAIALLGTILALFCTAQLFNPYLLRVEDKAYLDELAAQATTSRM
jgi:DHA3 family macrolide efflux protein-like MFS transporter